MISNAQPLPLAPLPVRRRRLDQESVSSYVRRLAAANGTDAITVRHWLVEQLHIPARFTDEQWLSVWGQLAARPALADGSTPADARIVARPLCIRCARGEYATGQLAGVGLICLKHRAWISAIDGSNADSLDERAERRFRQELVPAGIEFGFVQMRFAQRLAALAVSPTWVAARHRTHGTRSLAAALFDVQVRIACELFPRHALMELSRATGRARLTGCERWVAAQIHGLTSADEPWRAGGLLAHAARAYSSLDEQSVQAEAAVADILERLTW